MLLEFPKQAGKNDHDYLIIFFKKYAPTNVEMYTYTYGQENKRKSYVEDSYKSS
jgi:hypothetical protein